MSLHGIGLVARHEVRTRLRTGHWKRLMAVWFVIVNGLGLLLRVSMDSDDSAYPDASGVAAFGVTMLLVLALTLMVTPALSGQSINGDRERGTLATLQITRLGPGDIALGKLAAAWGTGVLTLLFALPCVLLPVVEGAIGPGRVAVVLLVTVLLIGVVCAVAQGWSALLPRTVTSMLMSYLTVFALLLGTVLLYVVGTAVVSEHTSVRSDRAVWWTLAPNPLVVLADAAPRLPERRVVDGDAVVDESPPDVLADMSRLVRDMREEDLADDRVENNAVWPYGLAFDLALAAGAVGVTIARLRTPHTRIPRGVRVA
ncbi:MAG TPA: hypothetical protein VIL71_17540 [Spirillospora sp.]